MKYISNVNLKIKYNDLSSYFAAPAVASLDLAFQQISNVAAPVVRHQWT